MFGYYIQFTLTVRYKCKLYITAYVLFPIGVFQGHLQREAETTHGSGY